MNQKSSPPAAPIDTLLAGSPLHEASVKAARDSTSQSAGETQAAANFAAEKVSASAADVAPPTADDVNPPATLKTHAAGVPVDLRGTAMAIILGLSLLFALQWANKFLIPLVFSILLAYTLNPLVIWMEKIKIPRFIGSTLLMLGIFCGIVVVTNTLYTEAQSIAAQIPEAARKVSRAMLKAQNGQPSAIQNMQSAANEIERAASQAAGIKPQPKRAPAQEATNFKLSEWLWAGSMGLIEFVGQSTMVLFLVYFLLLAGDTFKRKLVKITGPSLSNKKITVQILDNINISVQNYMFMLLVTNSLLVVMMYIAFRLVGMENAGAWAVGAGLLHIIPYFGPLLITVASSVSAFLQFGEISMALLVGGISLAVATVVGTFVTTWMTGRIAKMNPAAVFIGLLFWGWMWGVWGLLLGIPIIVVIKVIAEHVEGMQSIAELLSD